MLTENIKVSELGQSEINFLINELQNKIPFEGITIEDSLAGEVPPEDLLPFGYPGDFAGAIGIYYHGGEFGEAGAKSWSAIRDNIIAKYEAYTNKGIYGLGNNVYPNSMTIGHFSRGEYILEKSRRNEELTDYTNSVATGAAIGTLLGGAVGTLIGGFIGSVSAGGPPIYIPGVDRLYNNQPQEYGVDWKSQVVEELETLRDEIKDRKFERYFFQVDPERSFETQTLEGIPVSTGQLFWVVDPTDCRIWYSC